MWVQSLETAHPDCGSSVPVDAFLLFDGKSCTLLRFTAPQMGEFIVPSQQLLKCLVEQHGRQRMREALGEECARFQAVCLGEGGDCGWEPTMEDIITLSESFHLCVALPRKWAPYVGAGVEA